MGLSSYLKLPAKVYSGLGSLCELKDLTGGEGRVVILSDEGIGDTGIIKMVEDALDGKKAEIFLMPSGEPSCQMIEEMTERIEKIKAGTIIAVGGGSVMDTAKLAALLAESGRSVYDLLENPLKVKERKIRLIMLPTTAGTGAEATPNAIVSVPGKEIKIGIVNEALIADEVILDARLMAELPLPVLASTGIDALCHALECYTSKKANAFSDTFALDALEKIMKNLERAYRNAGDLEAKEQLLIAAFYGGVAITASGTTAVHALSYPLGGKYHIPHGIANAILLKPVLLFNESAIRPQLAAVGKRIFPGQEEGEQQAGQFLHAVELLLKNLSIPNDLKGFGIGVGDLEELTEAGMECKRLLNNNKKEMTRADVRAIYQQLI